MASFSNFCQLFYFTSHIRILRLIGVFFTISGHIEVWAQKDKRTEPWWRGRKTDQNQHIDQHIIRTDQKDILKRAYWSLSSKGQTDSTMKRTKNWSKLTYHTQRLNSRWRKFRGNTTKIWKYTGNRKEIENNHVVPRVKQPKQDGGTRLLNITPCWSC